MSEVIACQRCTYTGPYDDEFVCVCREECYEPGCQAGWAVVELAECGIGGPSMTAPDLSPDEAALVDLFELSDDGPYDPCPDCGNDPDDSRDHADGCRRMGQWRSGLQFGPPWIPWVLQP